MKKYDSLVIFDNNYVEVNGETCKSIMGKHCVWIPLLEAKVILSFQGHIESTEWMRGKRSQEIKNRCLNPLPGFTMESLYSIANEFRILHLLSEQRMSPSPREYLYIKSVKSKIFTDEWYTDPKGMFGYVVQDAKKLPLGRYDFSKFKSMFIDTERIKANPGALGDLERKAGNLINNYIVDVRRTMEHMMQVNEELDITKLLKEMK
jgi:hypothetical protein